MTEKLQKLLSHPAMDKAVTLAQGWEDRVSIVSHYDTDGICAGTIMLKAMLGAKKACSLRFLREFDLREIERVGEDALLIILDMGTGQLRELETLERTGIVVLDHHQPPEPYDAGNIIELNAHKLGLDGTDEACASTLSCVFAMKMSKENSHLVGDAVIGITGDRQHVPGMKGLNREIVEYGIRGKFLQEKRGELSLHEHEVGESLVKGVDPFFVGMSGREDVVKALLVKLGIAYEQKIEDLPSGKKKLLTEALLLRLLRHCNHVTVEEFVCTKYFPASYPVSVRCMSEYVNACGRNGRESLAVRMLMGDNDALSGAISMFEEHSRRIQDGLIYLESRGPERLESIQYFMNKDPAVSGTLGGLGMQYIFDQSRPTIVMAEKNNLLKISGRGTRPLVAKGLDLAFALKEAASEVGGTGGGHPIAAGATIPSGKKEEFLRKLDTLVKDQLNTGSRA